MAQTRGCCFWTIRLHDAELQSPWLLSLLSGAVDGVWVWRPRFLLNVEKVENLFRIRHKTMGRIHRQKRDATVSAEW